MHRENESEFIDILIICITKFVQLELFSISDAN